MQSVHTVCTLNFSPTRALRKTILAHFPEFSVRPLERVLTTSCGGPGVDRQGLRSIFRRGGSSVARNAHSDRWNARFVEQSWATQLQQGRFRSRARTIDTQLQTCVPIASHPGSLTALVRSGLVRYAFPHGKRVHECSCQGLLGRACSRTCCFRRALRGDAHRAGIMSWATLAPLRDGTDKLDDRMKIPGLEVRLAHDDLPWRSTRHAGIYWFSLHAEATAGDSHASRGSAVLIRMDPGCGYPSHRHVGNEEVLILQGGYEDERGVHLAGSYLRYEPGSQHAPRAVGDSSRPASDLNPACILFAVACDGVENLAPL